MSFLSLMLHVHRLYLKDLSKKSKIYFASDFHILDAAYGTERERCIISWLDMIKEDAKAIYLLGDIFDYWFEYKNHFIPSGFDVFLNKLSAIKKHEVEIFILGGNHDIWIGSYFEKSLGVKVLRSGDLVEIIGKKFYLHHGDALPNGKRSTRILKTIFTNPFCIQLFSIIPPKFGLKFMKYFSRKSRENDNDFARTNPVERWSTFKHFKQIKDQLKADYYIFGHMHAAAERTNYEDKSVFINLGEWISQRSYAVFDGNNLELKFYENSDGHIF